MVADGLFGDSARHAEITVYPREDETLVTSWKKCPALKKLYGMAMEKLARKQSVDPVMQRLAVKVGVLPHELQVLALHDIIASRQAHAKVRDSVRGSPF
jgi:hypothetical protein